MKKSPEIVKKKIIDWLNNEVRIKFPHLHVIYVYSEWDYTHYIHIDPIDEYIKGLFGKEALEFEKEFSKEFSNEMLCFVSMETFDESEKNDILFEFKSEFDFHSYKFLLNKIIEKVSEINLNFSLENNRFIPLELKNNKKKSEKLYLTNAQLIDNETIAA